MKTLIIFCLTGTLWFGSIRNTILGQDRDKQILPEKCLQGTHHIEAGWTNTTSTDTPPSQNEGKLVELQVKILVKSAELAKQCYDQEIQRSSLSPSDSLHQKITVKRLRFEKELAELYVRNAKSEITQVKFQKEHARQTAELAAIAKAEYDEVIAMNKTVPNAISVPEVNRLRLTWEAAFCSCH